jgi:hypothetical protein
MEIDEGPDPKTGEIIEDSSLKIKVVKVNKNKFIAKILKIKDPHFENYLTKNKNYTFSKWDEDNNFWNVPSIEFNEDCTGCGEVLLYSWPEGFSFEIDC